LIALIVESRCTGCNACVEACPSTVIDARADAAPVIARQADCQTCFLCELYCEADAIYVDPDCETPAILDETVVVAGGQLGRFRRESGWGEWADDPRYANGHWRMDAIFSRARALAGG
jgi:NAD-dependent dihydropyrimidine dehydrogenase PreA subunit